MATDALTASRWTWTGWRSTLSVSWPWTPSRRPAAGIRARPGRWPRPPMCYGPGSRSTLPTSSPRPGWAEQRKDGRWCQPSPELWNPSAGINRTSINRVSTSTVQGALARDLPETALRATSPRPTAQPSAAPFNCSVAWVGEMAHGDVNHPSINGMQGVRGSHPLSSTTGQRAFPPATGREAGRSRS